MQYTTINAGLHPDIERALLAKAAAAEGALDQAVQQAVKHLEAYRADVHALLPNKINEGTASALEEVARRSAATPQGNGVSACVSMLTNFGEVTFVPK